MRAIVYIPGLNDHMWLNRFLAKTLPLFWRDYEFYIIQPHWNQGKTFGPKLNIITQKIDWLSKKDYEIYIFGQSAGGSAALNAFVQRKNKVKAVVNICGRLRKGKNVFPPLDLAARSNPAFKDCVLLFENTNEKKLTVKDRKRVLTIRPVFDEIVPKSTVCLIGATNRVIPVIEHSIGGIAALTICSGNIKSFIT